MTAWDVLNNIINGFPPIVMALILVAVLAAVVIFIVGFSRHGVNFLKYGFRQTVMNDLLEKLATKEDISKIEAKFPCLIPPSCAFVVKFSVVICKLRYRASYNGVCP
jgi:hypothetical protein